MKKSLFIALLSLQSLWWSAASGKLTYFPTTPEEEQLAEDCRKSLPEQEKYEVALIEHFSVVEKTNAPNANPFVEDCSTIAVSNSSDYKMREILRLVDGPRAGLCSDVLILVSGNPVVCDYDRKLARGITYKPTTAELKDVEAACIENVKGPNGSALVLYEANPKGEFPGYALYDTLLPDDEEPYNEENCRSLFESRTTGTRITEKNAGRCSSPKKRQTKAEHSYLSWSPKLATTSCTTRMGKIQWFANP
jgi:hypothetical protein